MVGLKPKDEAKDPLEAYKNLKGKEISYSCAYLQVQWEIVALPGTLKISFLSFTGQHERSLMPGVTSSSNSHCSPEDKICS